MDDVQPIQINEEDLFRVRYVSPADGGRPKVWLPPVGNRTARVMLILSHPNFADAADQRLLSGDYLKEVQQACNAAGIDINDLYVTTMVKYGIGKKAKPSAEQIAECAPWLDYEIKMVKPELIMSLGAEVFKWLMKANMKQADYLGELVDSPYGKLLPNYSPGMILTQDPKKRPQFQDAFVLAKRFLDKTLNYQPFTWEIVTDPERNIEILVDYINRGLFTIGYDAEWTPGKMTNGEEVMTTFQYSCEPHHAIILDISPDLATENRQLLDTMRLILEHPKADRVGWNVRADDKRLILRGIRPLEETLGFDGMKAVAFFDSRYPKGLETGIKKYTPYDPYYMPLTKALREHKLTARDLAQLKVLAPEVYWRYCAGDAVSHRTACVNMREYMRQHVKPSVQDYYYNTYLPLSNYFIDLEMYGIPIDVEILEDLTNKFSSKFQELKARLLELVTPFMTEFNPASSPDKKTLLYEHLNLNPAYYTKAGKSPKPRAWYVKQKKDVQEQYQPSTNNKSLATIKFELMQYLEAHKDLPDAEKKELEHKLLIVSTLLSMNRVGVFANKFLDRRGTEYQPAETVDVTTSEATAVAPDGSIATSVTTAVTVTTPPEGVEEDEEDEPLKQSYWGALCDDRRIHADFFECLNNFRSSSKPNVQNPASKVLSHIPDIFVPGYASLSKEDRKAYDKLIPRNIRHIFYPGRPDFYWAEVDVAGADLAIAAFLSRDPDYIRDILKGGFHLTKAREYFRDPKIGKDDYSKYVSAKAITFRVAYTSELSAAALPIQSEIFAESGIYVKMEDIEYALSTWHRYEAYMRYREACKAQVAEHYIENARGIKYWFDQSDRFGIVAGWQNESLAYPIASELALFLWDVSVSMKRQLQKERLWMDKVIPVNSVHDASYWIIHKDLLKDNYFPELAKYYFTEGCRIATGDRLGMEMVVADRWKGKEVVFSKETKWDFENRTWLWK